MPLGYIVKPILELLYKDQGISILRSSFFLCINIPFIFIFLLMENLKKMSESMEMTIKILSDSMQLINYGKQYISAVPSLFDKTAKVTKTEILDLKSTLIKFGIIWLSEQSNTSPTQATKAIVENHCVTVLFPEYIQGIKRFGVSVENLEPIYTCVENGIKQKSMDPEKPHDLLYLAVGALGFRALGNVYSKKYIKTNDKKYSDAREKLEKCAEKIEHYIRGRDMATLGLEKFFKKVTEEKLYDIPIEEPSVDQNKPVAKFDVNFLFDEKDDLSITTCFEKGIAHLNKRHPTSAMHLAQSAHWYMVGEIDQKYKTAVFDSFRN